MLPLRCLLTLFRDPCEHGYGYYYLCHFMLLLFLFKAMLVENHGELKKVVIVNSSSREFPVQIRLPIRLAIELQIWHYSSIKHVVLDFSLSFGWGFYLNLNEHHCQTASSLTNTHAPPTQPPHGWLVCFSFSVSIWGNVLMVPLFSLRLLGWSSILHQLLVLASLHPVIRFVLPLTSRGLHFSSSWIENIR